MSRWLAALLLAPTSGFAAAQTHPTIREIAFEGDEVARAAAGVCYARAAFPTTTME